MTEDPTKDLTDSQKLNRILAELADLKAWRAKVDALFEDRARETRPKLDLIIKELSDVREEIAAIIAAQARLEQKFDWRQSPGGFVILTFPPSSISTL